MARPTLRTAFCDRVGVEYPIVLAGMGPVAGNGAPVATAELAAAVSNAGGLGVIGGVAYPPEVLRGEIRKLRSLTDKPFGVDLLVSPNFLIPRGEGPTPSMRGAARLPKAHVEAIERIARSLDIELVPAPPETSGMGDWVRPGQSWAGAQIEVLLEERVPVFASGLGTPKPFADALEANGITILSLVGTVKAARQVAADGADYVVAQGTEAGGHTGRIGTLALVPHISNPLLEAVEREVLHALPMGAQGLLIRDLQHSIARAGRHELLMKAAGKASGMLTEQRPAADILAALVAEAADLLGGVGRRVRVG